MSSYILCNFLGFSETSWYIGLKFSESEAVMFFQYSEISIYYLHQNNKPMLMRQKMKTRMR